MLFVTESGHTISVRTPMACKLATFQDYGFNALFFTRQVIKQGIASDMV